jgi:hypothetical protein
MAKVTIFIGQSRCCFCSSSCCHPCPCRRHWTTSCRRDALTLTCRPTCCQHVGPIMSVVSFGHFFRHEKRRHTQLSLWEWVQVVDTLHAWSTGSWVSLWLSSHSMYRANIWSVLKATHAGKVICYLQLQELVLSSPPKFLHWMWAKHATTPLISYFRFLSRRNA